MHHAAQDNGAVTAARQPKAESPAPKRRAVPALPAKEKRYRRSTARPTQLLPAHPAAYGFLKCRFLPHTVEGQHALENAGETVSFYTSLKRLCNHYGICPTEIRSLGMTYGKAIALWEVNRLLRTHREEHIAIEEESDSKGNVILCTTETYHTGNTLYYIPVIPLYHLLRSRKTKKAAELLLHACGYLMHGAGVPYYRDDSSYLAWQYERIDEWLQDDPESWDDGSYFRCLTEANNAAHIGDVLQRKLRKACHPANLEQRLHDFTAVDNFGRECYNVARQALRLWEVYPNASLYRHADESVLPDPEDDGYEEDCVSMDKYISFCASTKGWLYRTLEEGINGEFNECLEMQQPVIRHRFDGQLQSGDTLDFECRLFRLMDDLCYLLNNCDHENR